MKLDSVFSSKENVIKKSNWYVFCDFLRKIISPVSSFLCLTQNSLNLKNMLLDIIIIIIAIIAISTYTEKIALKGAERIK